MRRLAPHCLRAVAGCLVFAPFQLAGQAVAPFDAFTFPGKAATCDVVHPTMDNPLPTSTVIVFTEGEETWDGRQIESGFDSAGMPVWLTVRAYQLLESDSVARTWRSLPHAYFIRFAAGGKAEGFYVPGLIGPASRPIAASRGRPISDEVSAKARRLVEWVWENRCGRVIGGKSGEEPFVN